MSAFKTVYFPDYHDEGEGRSGLTVAFNQDDERLFKAVSRLSSFAIRKAIGHDRYAKVQQAADRAGLATSAYVRKRLKDVLPPARDEDDGQFDTALQSTFSGGRGSPLHDWFPYLEGYSPDFVRTILETHAPTAQRVLDPFCGSGTTAITSARMGLHASFCEVNPVCRTVIAAKAVALACPDERRRALAADLLEVASMITQRVRIAKADEKLAEAAKATFGRRPFFDDLVFRQALSLRTIIDDLKDADRDLSLLTEVAVMGVLVANSRLIRRGDLRFRNDRELQYLKPDLLGDLVKRLHLMASDMQDIDQVTGSIELACNDVRSLDNIQHGSFDAIITSPPYLNGTNYFRNTKVELWFSRYLSHKDGLRVFRDAAITSGINDVTNRKTGARDLPHDRLLRESLDALAKEAYDQRIPKMVASYFAEMAEVAGRLAAVARSGGIIAIDLGDSCYGDVLVPTDVILRGIMSKAGCTFQKEVVLRERQSRSGRSLRQTLQIFEAR